MSFVVCVYLSNENMEKLDDSPMQSGRVRRERQVSWRVALSLLHIHPLSGTVPIAPDLVEICLDPGMPVVDSVSGLIS